MEVQAALGSDIALVFDECTPFHVTRDYTAARWTAPTAGSSAACAGMPRRSSRAGGVRDRPGRRGARPARWIGRGGRRQRLRRDRDRRLARTGQGTDARGRVLDDGRARAVAPDRPRHLLGIGDVDDLIAGVELASTRSTARCRPGSGATAWRSCPTRRPLAGGSVQGPVAEPQEPPQRLPVPGLPGWAHPRVPALPDARRRAHRARLLTLHNLSFIARLMRDLREGDRRGPSSGGGRGASCWRRAEGGVPARKRPGPRLDISA